MASGGKRIKIVEEEKEALIEVSAKLKAENENITLRQIETLTDRSDDSILKVMGDKKFNIYKDKFKKKIEARRMQIIGMADDQIYDAVKEKKLNPYQLIGLTKTLHEQVWPVNTPQVGINAQQMAVQVVRGTAESGSKSKDKP